MRCDPPGNVCTGLIAQDQLGPRPLTRARGHRRLGVLTQPRAPAVGHLKRVRAVDGAFVGLGHIKPEHGLQRRVGRDAAAEGQGSPAVMRLAQT